MYDTPPPTDDFAQRTLVLPPANDCPTVETAVPPVPTVPGYVLEERVGIGGFAEVYRGRQIALDRPVAVKVIDPGPAGDPRLFARVRTEATTMGRFQHPNIVPVYDYGQDGGRVYIVMELLLGEDLGRRVSRGGRLDERTAWLVARQAAAGLAHAAAHGVVHRDIKPGNLFLVPPPAGSQLPADVPLVKVTDFGIARARWAVDGSDNPVTAPGAALGTPAYMAPEQHGGASEVDHRADIYALGATVYHALAGHAPFSGATVWEMLARKQENAPPPIAEVSPESAELIAAMMAVDPADRVESYDELIALIDGLPVVGAAPAARPARPTRRRKGRRRVLPVGLIALALLVAGAAWAVRGRRPAEPPVSRFVAAEAPMPLFKRSGLDRFVPESGEWGLATDEERVNVIEGRGRVRLKLSPLSDYQLTLGLDPGSSTAAEMRVGRSAGTVYAVRLESGGGARFGVRQTAGSEFRPLGPAVPVPPAGNRSGGRPYLEVKIERTDGIWSAWFDGQPLGRAADPGRPEPAAWLHVEGGTVRIDTAELTPLVPAP